MSKEEQDRPVNWKISLILCLLIAGGTYGIIKYIYSTEPKAQRVGATIKSAMLVDVVRVRQGDYRPQISVLGKVEPSVEIMLSPQVSGRITFRADNFTPGGFVSKGDILYRIDEEDYKNILKEKKAMLLKAETELKLEEGRRNVALEEFKILNQELAQKNKDLILRVPQMAAVKADIKMAGTAVEKAELDLSRTVIKAPFDGMVFSRSKDFGSQVSAGEVLGRIVGHDEYWVMASIPLSKLKWMSFPGNGAEPSAVTIRDRASWDEDVTRSGTVTRVMGELEEESRMARVLITVRDPLSLSEANKGKPKLIIGVILKVDIEGRMLKDIVRIPRKYLRTNDTAWIMEDGKLKISRLNVILKDTDYAYVREGLEAGDRVVTTNLSRVVAGAALRVEQSEKGGK